MEDTKSVYGGIRKAVEPTKNLTSPCYQKPDKYYIVGMNILIDGFNTFLF